MMIRQEFQQLPPKLFMMQILNDLPKVYIFLWEKKNKENIVQLTWKDLSRYYNKNTFRSNLRKLNNEGLLDYQETDRGISIELVGWDEIERDESD